MGTIVWGGMYPEGTVPIIGIGPPIVEVGTCIMVGSYPPGLGGGIIVIGIPAVMGGICCCWGGRTMMLGCCCCWGAGV